MPDLVSMMLAGFKSRRQISLAVRLRQRTGDLDGILQEFCYGQRTFTDAGGQRFAFQEFHHEKIHAVLMTEIMQSADVGVIQGRCGARLSFEALAQFRPVSNITSSNLDRYRPIETCISRFVNFAHTTHAKI